MLDRLTNAENPATFAEVSFDANRDQKCPQKFSHAHIADRHLWFAIMCKALWGEGATAALFDLVGQHLEHKDERQCRRWARGESEPPQSILWMLIASKEGWRVEAFIGGEQPSWEEVQHALAIKRAIDGVGK
jgi:hypothetical protein